MFSFIFVTHGDLGASLVRTAEFIMNERFDDRCETFSLDYSMLADMDRIKELLERSVDRIVTKGHRAIVFVDIFGGSPSNVAFTFAKRDEVDILSGVNLPMVIYAFEHRDAPVSIAELTAGILQSGDESLISAKKLLEKEHR
ncbi:MAG TPA: hypothetical protein PKH10_03575 [bacterium]|nr:hypothetical protein [bacterium]